MKQRRGSSLWGETDGLSRMIYCFEPGDLVTAVAVQQFNFLGIVKEVLPKINKVMVLWNGGSLKQHDPDEITLAPHQNELVRARMSSSRRGLVTAENQVPSGDQYVGNPDTHGINAPRGGGFSIMQDLQKDLHKEMKKESDVATNPRESRRGKASFFVDKGEVASDLSLRSRRAMYWEAPDRVYRLTREEQQTGSALCPKCQKEMNLEPFTKSDKLYTCQKCGFKVPTSKTTTTRITIDVDKQTGEVDVDVTTAKGMKSRRSKLGDKKDVKYEIIDERTQSRYPGSGTFTKLNDAYAFRRKIYKTNPEVRGRLYLTKSWKEDIGGEKVVYEDAVGR